MKKPLISVISIIYGVEPYIRECLTSLSALTYPELELILVVGQKESTNEKGERVLSDDGCLSVAEEFASKDPRFKIVSCIANGVSDARNRGLDAASGEYIGFVDGDDYVEPAMYDRLYDNLAANNADISVCGKYSEYPGRSVADSHEDRSHPEILSPGEAAAMILRGDGFFFHCWDKLFNAGLFNGIRFPEDKYVEDRYVTGDLILNARKIVYDRAPLYHFRVRTDSMSRHKKISEINSDADTIFAGKVLERFPELRNEAEAYLLYGHITCLQNALISGEFSREEEKHHFEYIRTHKDSIKHNPFVSGNTRIKAFLSLHFLPGLRLITLRGKRKQDSKEKFSKT